MAKINPPAQPPVTEAPADAPEFRTGRVHSESRRYDHAHGQQVVEGNEEYVTFLEDVADEDAVAMIDDPKASAPTWTSSGSAASSSPRSPTGWSAAPPSPPATSPSGQTRASDDPG